MSVDIVRTGSMDWSLSGEKHREGQLAFKRLFVGKEGDPENYRLVLSKNNGGYSSPRHRHNFDQIRYCVEGRLSIAPRVDMMEGDAGYFPEGVFYGPQKDGAEDRLALVMQFGGASGSGFLSTDQIKQAQKELSLRGTFEGGAYRHGDSRKKQDAFEAVWEHASGRKLEYPAPRYRKPVIARSFHFEWVAMADGISSKPLGSFAGRGIQLDLFRLEPGSAHVLGARNALTLLLALAGDAGCSGERLVRHDAIRIPCGETATIAAKDATALFAITLPSLSAHVTDR